MLREPTRENITRARRLAKRHNEVYIVASIEQGDRIVQSVLPLDETGFDEFWAFDGRVLCEVWPDGSIEE